LCRHPSPPRRRPARRGRAAGRGRRRRRPAPAAAAPAAPGAPGAASTWSPGDKDGFGTARTRASKVWYTLNQGVLSEVFFPRIDTPATRDTQLVVSDGSSFADREDTATEHQVRLLEGRSLVYRQVNTASSGRYRITKPT
jgi:glucoamylase